MASFSQLLLWSCVLHFCTSITGQNRTTAFVDSFTGKNLTCPHNVRVLLASHTWTAQKSFGKGPSDVTKFLERIIWQIETTSKESGIHCTSDKRSHVVTCCDDGNLDQFNNIVDNEKPTAFDKFWYYDMKIINMIFLFVNCLLFLVVLCTGIMLAMDYADIVARSEPI